MCHGCKARDNVKRTIIPNPLESTELLAQFGRHILHTPLFQDRPQASHKQAPKNRPSKPSPVRRWQELQVCFAPPKCMSKFKPPQPTKATPAAKSRMSVSDLSPARRVDDTRQGIQRVLLEFKLNSIYKSLSFSSFFLFHVWNCLEFGARRRLEQSAVRIIPHGSGGDTRRGPRQVHHADQ